MCHDQVLGSLWLSARFGGETREGSESLGGRLTPDTCRNGGKASCDFLFRISLHRIVNRPMTRKLISSHFDPDGV